MLGSYKPASDRQTELDKFFALSGYPLMVMREIYNRLYGEIDTSPFSSSFPSYLKKIILDSNVS